MLAAKSLAVMELLLLFGCSSDDDIGFKNYKGELK
tara:strand:+ start:595 stop:699 length:105 start_codon:yes stop_codon:yes gene_type:complete